MEWDAVFQIATASIASIGIGGAMVFAMSSWLAKVWASRILERERKELSTELEQTKHELDVLRETTLRFQNDKILTYRGVVDVVSKALASFDSMQGGRLDKAEAAARFDQFNEQRIRIYGYLAMLAPQQVMDAQDNLMDHLLKVANGNAPYKWERVRELAIILLNEVRLDIGIDKTPIQYNGEL